MEEDTLKALKLIKSGENLFHDEIDIEERKCRVEKAFGDFLTALGYDWLNDCNMRETPKRVAKMYVQEVTKGVYMKEPKITTFDNNSKYIGVVFEGNIEIKSLCSHHFQPFVGKCHVAYLPTESSKIVGLSKLNRMVDFFARRPQLQENLTKQIHDFLNKTIGMNKGIAVMIEAQHMCVYLRGVEQNSTMITTELSGAFLESGNLAREEFYHFINNLKK